MLGLIGSGSMNGALALGWGDPVVATDSGSGRAGRLVARLGGEDLGTDLEAAAARCDTLLLGHKPYQLAEVAGRIGPSFTGLVVSVLGGVTLAQLRDAYPQARVSSVMPNTAVEVRRGVSILAAGGDDPEVVRSLFARVGTVVELPEGAANAAATGISGVGPAYVALVAEAWTDAGVRAGLKAEVAAELVRETLAGAAELLRETDTLAIRRGVSSPGGSTARGLRALVDGNVPAAFQAAMDATTRGANA